MLTALRSRSCKWRSQGRVFFCSCLINPRCADFLSYLLTLWLKPASLPPAVTSHGPSAVLRETLGPFTPIQGQSIKAFYQCRRMQSVLHINVNEARPRLVHPWCSSLCKLLKAFCNNEAAVTIKYKQINNVWTESCVNMFVLLFPDCNLCHSSMWTGPTQRNSSRSTKALSRNILWVWFLHCCSIIWALTLCTRCP